MMVASMTEMATSPGCVSRFGEVIEEVTTSTQR
jgi:hypothetical protein